jgi:hypothetical protein
MADTPIQTQAKSLKQSVSIDLDEITGLVNYKGRSLTYAELQWEFDQEEIDLADLHSDNKDFTRDITQNSYGRKPFYEDNWYGLKKPIKKLRGYPSEILGSYESVPAPENNPPDEHGNV